MLRRHLASLTAAAGAAAALGTGVLAGGQPVALSIPASRVCADGHDSIVAAVRSTANPRGPRRFVVEVRNPQGRIVLYREGIAQRRWRLWRYDPPPRRSALGTYTTTYRVSTGREVFRTRVVFCA